MSADFDSFDADMLDDVLLPPAPTDKNVKIFKPRGKTKKSVAVGSRTAVKQAKSSSNVPDTNPTEITKSVQLAGASEVNLEVCCSEVHIADAANTVEETISDGARILGTSASVQTDSAEAINEVSAVSDMENDPPCHSTAPAEQIVLPKQHGKAKEVANTALTPSNDNGNVQQPGSTPDAAFSEPEAGMEAPQGQIYELESDVSLQSKPNKAEEEVSTVDDVEDEPPFQHSHSTGGMEILGASNFSSNSCSPMDIQSQTIETPESCSAIKELLTNEMACQDTHEVSAGEKVLQTDPDKPDEEAMPVISGMESLDDIFSQPSHTAASKPVGKFPPKSVSRLKMMAAKSVSFTCTDASETAGSPVEYDSVPQPKTKKAKSVSFSLPDAAETAHSPGGAHTKVLADDMMGTESFTQMTDDESLDKIPHLTSLIPDNPGYKIDNENGRNEHLADLSGLGLLNSCLSDSTSGKKLPKFHPKSGVITMNKNSTSSGNTTGSEDTSSLEDYTPVDIANLEDGSITPDPFMSINEQEEAGSPDDNENDVGGMEELSGVSEGLYDAVPCINEEETQQVADDQANPRASGERGTRKSSRLLKMKTAPSSVSAEGTDPGTSEAWDIGNSQMNEDPNDDEYRGEDIPKQSKRSKRQTSDAKTPAKRQRNNSKGSDSAKREPPKKKFPHGTRRKKRQVDKVLLETPEYELNHRQIPISQLIMLGEARERASKEAGPSENNQSNTGPSSNSSYRHSSYFDEENPDFYGDDETHQDAEQRQKEHREMLRNAKHVHYHTYMNHTKSKRWSKSETELFFQAIRQFGTDFEMIAHLFPNRTRRQVKLKFKTEECKHPLELQDAMSHRSKDTSHFEKVIKILQAEAGDKSQQDDADGDTATGSQEAANRDKSDQPRKEDEDGADEDADFEKIEEWDGVDTSNYNDYEDLGFDGYASPRNEDKYSELDDLF